MTSKLEQLVAEAKAAQAETLAAMSGVMERAGNITSFLAESTAREAALWEAAEAERVRNRKDVLRMERENREAVEAQNASAHRLNLAIVELVLFLADP